MAKTTTRKVTKVARTGGGRTKRGQGSWFFPALVTTVVVLGTALVIMSRNERQPDTSAPQVGVDHWHAAIGFDLCGTFAPNVPDTGNDPLGIHTHGDGIVHVHPFSSQAAGQRATLGVYFDAVGIDASATSLKLPTDQRTYRNGDDCNGQEASLVTKIWDTRAESDQGRTFTGNPRDIRLTDNQLITIAFVPAGTEVRKPPSEPMLDNLSDVPNAATTTLPATTTTVEETTTTTAVP
ncbi:MAG: hypothetical protein AB1673_12805 [Actinomycetota bacterium]